MPKRPTKSEARSHRVRSALERWVQRSSAAALVSLLRGYQLLVRPLLGPSCRFAPSCSEYALEAVRRHGPWTGARLALGRLGRCHPWQEGGHDPVPSVKGG